MFHFSCNTDILLGKRCGFKTLVVLTGITTQNDIENMNASDIDTKNLIIPDYYANELGDILEMTKIS